MKSSASGVLARSANARRTWSGWDSKKPAECNKLVGIVHQVPRQFPNLKQCTVLFENGQVHPDNVEVGTSCNASRESCYGQASTWTVR